MSSYIKPKQFGTSVNVWFTLQIAQRYFYWRGSNQIISQTEFTQYREQTDSASRVQPDWKEVGQTPLRQILWKTTNLKYVLS